MSVLRTSTAVFLLWHAIAFVVVSNLGSVDAANRDKKHINQVIVAYNGAVATDDRRCSRIGMDALREGGHAADAAVAAALCLGVVSPASSGLGGGAFMLLRLANGVAKAFDMREVAPSLASKDMYGGNATLKEKGGLSVAVPGELAGLHKVWKQHGKLPWERLVKPAEILARKGFKISPFLRFQLERSESDVLEDTGLRSVFARNGKLLKRGDICYNKKLADTLKIISKNGPQAFYGGLIGLNLVEDVQKAGGILSMKDLKSYSVKEKEPISTDVLGLKILGMPPASGGPPMMLLLNILAQYDLPSGISGALGYHREIEALKHVFAVRMNANIVFQVSLETMGFTGYLTPRIGALKDLTTLSLQGNGITGDIPKELGNLTKLIRLDLENNRLNGEIPPSLGNLKKLQFLTLSQNNLSGTIPESFGSLPSLINVLLDSNNLIGQIPEQLFQVPKYNFTGNKLNCGKNYIQPCASNNEDQGSSHKSETGLIVGIIIGLVAILLLGGLLLFWCRGRHKGYKREVFVDVAGEVDRRIAFGQLKRFAWRELQIATDNFSEKNVLGQGGFGKVYKGVLADNTKVAVKRLTDYESPGGDAAFQREVEMISVAVHRNLLRLIGFCTTPTERLLVYPFMQNLSVAYRLREIKPGESVLDWPTRKRVALGTARGLEYLHEHCNPKIIHRDVKAANVLLDEDFEAVVGDFGLAKLVDIRKTNVTTQIRGTMGHIAPEYLSTGKSSGRTDVFGYGIMLLEIVTGQRAIDFSRLEEEDDVLLLDHVKKLEREKRLDAIVDRNLNKNYNIEEVEMMIQVALLCTQSTPEDRPMMSEVVRMLEGEGLAERWEEWQHVEVNRRQEYERLQRRFDWGEDSVYNQDAIELSGGR